MESRIHGDVYVRFGGEFSETYHRQTWQGAGFLSYAEIASMMLGSELQIGHDPKQHVAYVDSWIQILTEKPFEIHQAAADAQKISDFLMTYDRKRELNQSGEIYPEQENARIEEEGYKENEFKTSIKIGR